MERWTLMNGAQDLATLALAQPVANTMDDVSVLLAPFAPQVSAWLNLALAGLAALALARALRRLVTRLRGRGSDSHD